MHNFLKNSLLLLLNIIIFYFLISWIMKNIDIVKFQVAFSSVSIGTIFIILCINLLPLFFYSKRLSTILNKNISISFALVNLGYGLNAILPFRMGEVAKLLYAKKIFHIPSSQFVVATFIEKYFDILFLGFLVSFFLIFAVQNYINARFLLVLFGLLISAMIAIFIIRKIISYLKKRERWSGKIKAFLLSVEQYSVGHDIKKLLILSGLVWVSNILSVYATFNILLPTALPLIHAVGLLIVLALAVAIPVAPAGLGFFEAGIVAYLVSMLHINNEAALMSAILFHLAVTVPQFIIMLSILTFSKLKRLFNVHS